MKETFQNFRYWLVYNLDQTHDRAEEIASRLRTIEKKLADTFGDNCLRSFFLRFNKVYGLPKDQAKKMEAIFNDYKGIYNWVSVKKGPFNGISSKLQDEYKVALRYYLLFIGTMTGRFTEDKVKEYCPSERGLKGLSINAIPARIFKNGLFTAMRKKKCVFPGKDSRLVTIAFDKLNELIEYEVERRMQSKGGYDAIEYTSFMINLPPRVTFDWRMVLIDCMEVYVGEERVTLRDSRWVSVKNDMIGVDYGYENIGFQLPVFGFTNKRQLSLNYIPSFNGSIVEHLEYMKRLFVMVQKLQDTLQRIPPQNIEEYTENEYSTIVKENGETLIALAQEACDLLEEYASRFRVDIIAE